MKVARVTILIRIKDETDLRVLEYGMVTSDDILASETIGTMVDETDFVIDDSDDSHELGKEIAQAISELRSTPLRKV